MKILHVSGFDLSGAQANGYLLHRYFREHGYDSSMAVHFKQSDDPHVHRLNRPIPNAVGAITQRLEQRLSLYSFLPAQAANLYFMKCYRQADIVHLHLPHVLPFFSIFNLPLMARRKRLVWSIHDMFMMTGHCTYARDCERWKTGCGQCPDFVRPFQITRDTTAWSWKVKKWLMHRSPMHLIAGSPWLREQIADSPILNHLPVAEIPYGTDLTQFRPRDKLASRRRFGIPDDAFVLTFRAVSWAHNVKGTDYIIKALQMLELDRPVYCITMDSYGAVGDLREKYEVIELGWVNDQETVAEALSAADLFLMPSLAEGFGLMATEAMASGTPVIVFEGTALPRTVNAPHAGIAVPRDAHALSRAVADLMADEARRREIAENGRRYVRDRHSFDAYADAHLKFYEGLMRGDRLQG